MIKATLLSHLIHGYYANAGPVPSLDGENIVFGRVLEGLSTIGAITAVCAVAESCKHPAVMAAGSRWGRDASHHMTCPGIACVNAWVTLGGESKLA